MLAPLMAKTGLGPVVDERTRIVILGSFPGEESLRLQQYYGHPFNSFWKIMNVVVGESLTGMPYEQRLQTLLKHRIGIWDVYQACEREGSLDADIKKGECNDFSVLAQRAPKLKYVCFNGKTAGKYASMLSAMGYKTTILPSTSPANRNLTYEQKLKEWQKGIHKV
jgi:double-stranded uracil-DNA glycosylase